MFQRKHNNTASSGSHAPAASPHTSTVEAPPILHETVRYDTVREVQPVIHRQVDQIHVHHVEKHIMGPPAPSMAESFERPALVQDHINHRFVTEIHPVYHAPSYQIQDGVQTVHGPVLPMAQQQQYGQQFAQQQVPVGSNAPRAVAPTQQYAPRAKHHIFHRS